MSYLLNLLYLFAALLLTPVLLTRCLIKRKPIAGFLNKLFGQTPRCGANQKTIWFHGVSVGEIHLLRQVIAAFRARHPNHRIVLSTTTSTGMSEAKKHFPDLDVFFFPFDFTWAVKRAMRRIRPTLIVLAESEIWPNFLLAARKGGYRIAVINARMSPKSARRWNRFRWLARPLWNCISLFVVQSQEHSDNLASLGVDREKLHVTGSVKYDGVLTAKANPLVETMRSLLSIQEDDLIWIAGSTQAPEEEIALNVYLNLKPEQSNLRLILVPRQKERFDEVAKMLERREIPFARRSLLNQPTRADVILVDTFGELSALWALSHFAFVGGSLDGKRGGQNMIEPAAMGSAVVFGTHVWNFRDTARRLLEADAAIQIRNENELLMTMQTLLANEEERRRMGQRARTLVEQQQGATAATIQILDRLLQDESVSCDTSSTPKESESSSGSSSEKAA